MYLHPSCPPSQAADIRKLARSLDANAHNLICGDFNFALHSYDRISKFDASCTGESYRDKATARVWQSEMNGKSMVEFAQSGFTFEGASGWSKLNRCFTDLHPAIIATKHTACNTLEHPRYLSDHCPISFCIQSHAPTKSDRIPAWVASDPEFVHEVKAEFTEACFDIAMTPFQKLEALKSSIKKASKYIRNKCRNVIATTVSHRLATTLSFIRSLESGNLCLAKRLQSMYNKLTEANVDGNWKQSGSYRDVLDHAANLMSVSVRERMKELRTKQEELSESIYDQRKRSILSTLLRLAP